MSTIKKQEINLKEEVNEYILSQINNDKSNNTTNKNLLNIISFLSEKESSIDEIMKIIEDYTSSTQIKFKESSMSLLKNLSSSDKIEFSLQNQEKIFNFVVKKLKDISCVPKAVQILFDLYEKYNFLQNSIMTTALKYYRGEVLNIPAYSQSTRNFALKLLQLIIEKGDLSEKQIQIDLCIVVLDCIDAEKDPRNLLIVFKIVKDLCNKVQKEVFANFTNNFFEILNEYYPIEFTPPKDIKNPITAKQLSDALDDSISLECFSENFFDRLNDYEMSSAGDIMITLQKISKNYSHEKLSKYFSNIFNFIINAITNTIDEGIHIEALITLTKFLKHYSPYDNQINKVFENLSDKVFSEDQIKQSYDAKDVLCSIIEYDTENKFLEKATQIVIKLISLFMLMKKHFHFLKNANSLLFFVLKKSENLDIKVVDILNQNKNMILSLITDEKIYENSLQNFIPIVDIFTAIVVKVKQEIFQQEKIKEIFDLILQKFNKYTFENQKDLDHLAICICELSKKINANLFDFYKTNTEDQYKQIIILKNLMNLQKIESEQIKILSFFLSNLNQESYRKLVKDIVQSDYLKNKNIFEAVKDDFVKVLFNNISNQDFSEIVYELLKEKYFSKEESEKFVQILVRSQATLSNIKLLHYFIIEENFINQNVFDNLLPLLKEKYFSEQTEMKVKKKIVKCVSDILPKCSDSIKSKVIESAKAEEEKDNENFSSEEKFKIFESYQSAILNFILSTKKENDKVIDLIIQKVSSSKYPRVFETSKLFYIKEMSEELQNELLIKLKPVHKERKFINLLLNIYLSRKSNSEYTDIIFSLNKECLLQRINSKRSITKMREILKDHREDNMFKRNCGLGHVAEITNKILEYITDEDMSLKIEGIKLVGILKDYANVSELTDEKRKDVIIDLRKFLCDKKRLVRKYAGTAITIWSNVE